MAMLISHNNSATTILNQLNRNNTQLGKALEKVSSGQKINSAGDEASAYSISEKMREQIRTLGQNRQNVQNGSSMLKTAYGGVQDIINELRSLKELALNAANDSNSDDDRAIIQRDFDMKRDTIDDIATLTNYNTKKLLDGTYKRPLVFDSEELSEPTGVVKTITTEDYNITSNGVYTILPSSEISEFRINITDGVKNVKFTQSDSSTTPYVHIKGPSSGNFNLWLENVNWNSPIARNGYDDYSTIKFQSENNTLNIRGNNTIQGLSGQQSYSPIINMGDGLTINGVSDGTLNLVQSFSNNESIRGVLLSSAVIGTVRNLEGTNLGTGGNLTLKNANINKDYEALFRQADESLYCVKENGRNGYCLEPPNVIH
ncbi:MAG: hypothetical protein IJ563_11025 [Selenomonadaceae bacterium]|nr:hypothetical protein [Selenomonadaceae bacterium]